MTTQSIQALRLNEEIRVVLVASQDIPAGTPLSYDYGESDPDTVNKNPWLRDT